MKDCSPSVVPIVKGDKLGLNQCLKNDLENESMKNIPYASAVGSLMYVKVCTRPDIAFAIRVLGLYQSNPGMDHKRVVRKVMRYLQDLKVTCLCIDKWTTWMWLAILTQILLAVLILINQHLGIFLLWKVELFL